MYFWGMFPVPAPPDWVVPDREDFTDCAKRADRYRHGNCDPRLEGVHRVFIWLTIGERSPITQRLGTEATRDMARAESWYALCLAAGQEPPTARDWERLKVEPRPAVAGIDRDFAYGVWTTLQWVLGVFRAWPVHGPGEVAAGIPFDRPHIYVPRQRRNTPEWLAADRAARDQAEHEASRHWRHIRQLTDTTA